MTSDSIAESDQVLSVPQLPWHGDTELELRFPASWDVTLRPMRGYDRSPLTEKGIKRAFDHPIGTQRIAELARGKKEVVIIFDDITRPTKAYVLVSYVLRELEEAGIPDESIRFIVALGAHGANNRLHFEKKLGREIVDRFPVYNHNPYENCTYLGTTSRGTPVSINSEVMRCDLKIGIGCIMPHGMAGFGGGGKIIMPGVASMDGIDATHRVRGSAGRAVEPSIGRGKVKGNVVLQEIEEATRMAGLDVKVDVVVNHKRDALGVFVGDPVAEYTEAVKLAREVYATEPVDDVDIIVANTYCKTSTAVGFLFDCKFKNRLDMVFIVNSPEGKVTHYLQGRFGKYIGGKRWIQATGLPPNVNRLIVLSPYIDKSGTGTFGPPGAVVFARSWTDVIEELKVHYPNGAKVAVYPDVALQYFPDSSAI